MVDGNLRLRALCCIGILTAGVVAGNVYGAGPVGPGARYVPPEVPKQPAVNRPLDQAAPSNAANRPMATGTENKLRRTGSAEDPKVAAKALATVAPERKDTLKQIRKTVLPIDAYKGAPAAQKRALEDGLSLQKLSMGAPAFTGTRRSNAKEAKKFAQSFLAMLAVDMAARTLDSKNIDARSLLLESHHKLKAGGVGAFTDGLLKDALQKHYPYAADKDIVELKEAKGRRGEMVATVRVPGLGWTETTIRLYDLQHALEYIAAEREEEDRRRLAVKMYRERRAKQSGAGLQ